MSSKVQAALEARKKQKEEEEKKRFSVEDALSYRDSQIKKNLQSTLADLQDSFTKEVESYKNLSSLTYGTDLKSVLESTNESRVNLGDLKRKAEAYRKYIGDDKTTEIVSYIDKLKSGYDSYLSNAEFFSAFDTEDDYNKWVADNEEYEKKKSYDLASGEKELSSLEGILSEAKKLETKVQATDYLKKNGYSSIDELENAISSKKVYHNQAKRIQEGIRLSGVADPESLYYDPEFENKSGYVSTESDAWYSKLTSQYGLGYGDLAYEYINNVDGIRDEINDKARAYGKDTSPYNEKGYDYLTEQEVAIYNYYYAKDGKEAAEKYLDNLQETLNHRKATDRFESRLEGNTVSEILFGVEAGLDQFASGVKNLFNFSDDYIPTSSVQMAAQMVREDLSDDGWKLPEFLGGSSLGQVAYDITNTTSNMLPSIIVGAVTNPIVGTSLLGASAAGNAYQEMLNYGYDKGQARMYSTLVGVSEAGLSYVLGGISSLGGKATGGIVTKLLSKVDNAYARAAIRFGSSILSEGFEEGLQEYLNPWFKSIALNTDYEAANLDDILYSGLLGALSAFGLEGTNIVSSEVATYSQGKSLKTNGEVDRLAELGKTFSADTVAYQIANKVNKDTGAYTIGRLFNEVGASLSEANIKDITNALVERGIDKNQADTIAKWMSNTVNGVKLTERQQEALEKNPVIADVWNDVIINPNSTVMQRSIAYSYFSDMSKSKSEAKTSDAYEIYNDPETVQAIVDEGIAAPEGTQSKALATEYSEILKNGGTLSTEQVQKLVSANEEVYPAEKTTTKYKVGVDGKVAISLDETASEATSNKDENFDTTTGEKVSNFKEFSDISLDGKVAKLRLEDGNEVNAKNVSLANSSDAYIVEGLLNMTVDNAHIDTNTANVLLKEMRNSINAPLSNKAAFNNLATMIAGTREALTYGYYGYDSKLMMRESGMASEISDSLRNTAYVLGRDMGKARSASSQAKITEAIEARKQSGVEKAEAEGKLRFADGEKKALEGLSSDQKAVVDFFRDIAVATPSGIKLIGYDKRANGYTNLTTGEMVFSLESNASRDPVAAVLFTAGHESGHYIKLHNPEGFNRLGEFLAKEYGKKGVSVHAHVLAMQKKSKSKLTYDEAHEEWVCQSLQRMFASVINNKDSGVLQRLQQYDNKVAQLLYKALSKLASKISSLLEKLTPGTFEEQFVAEMDATARKLFEAMYAEELVTAIDNAQWLSGVDVMTEILGNKNIEVGKTSLQEMNRRQTRFQEKTEYEAQPKEIITVGTDANKPKANRKTLGGRNKITIAGKTFGGDVSVKELRDARFKENGFSQEKIDKHNEFIQHMAEMMEEARVKYRFIGLDDIYNAKILISPTSGEITLSALVNNGDYPINFDFTKVCKKRVALQQIVDQLARQKGKENADGTITEVNLSPENIKAINDILADAGIETACLCCFVESKRYNIQSLLQENVIDVWNSLVDEFDSTAGYFNFADESVNESKIPDKEFDALYEQVVEWRKQKGKSNLPEEKMRQFLETTPAARKKLRFADLVTEKGRTNLHKLYPDIESLVGSKLGTSAPKSIEAFAPYNGEIDLMEATGKTDLGEYLFSIAGARSQSFSDFMIAHIFDVVQKTASLSARKFPAHVYTKEIARARLFGMTGEKHNMSVLFNIDPEVDSWNAGLKKDGSYFLSDYKAYSKKESQYIQSIGWDDAVNLQNTEGYSKDCGIIGVGFSYNSMIKLHNDPEVRQVIGYHTSSLSAVVKPLTHLDKATDYTPVQNTLAFKGFVKPMYAIPEGVPSYATPPQDIKPIKGSAKTQKVNDTFDIKATFEKLAKGKKGEARTQAAKETLRQLLEYADSNGLALVTQKAEAGHGDFDLYSDVEQTKNPYMSADHYIEYCIERGYLPAFFEFSMNPNYYKDIFDWTPFDRLSYNPETGLHEDSDGRQAYAPQTAVHMLNEDGSYAFPSDFFEIVDKQMKNYDEYSQMVKSKMPKVLEAITSIEGMGSNLKLQEKVSEDAKAFAHDIDQWNRDGKPNDESFILGSTGDVLQGLGAIESDIYMLGDKINEILIKHPEMTLDEIKKIPQILENPILILKSKGEDRGNNNNTRLVIFGSVKAKDNRPILSVLDLRPQEDNLVIDDMQKVTSAYTKDNNPVSFVRSSDVLYADKNKTTKLLKSIGFQMPIELQQSGYIGSISYFKRSVNIKGESFSNVFKEDVVRYQERDSEGNTLSEGQQEFFKDSKVRDKKGNLLVLYHGTNSHFTVFDSNRSDDKRSFFLTDSSNVAHSYAFSDKILNPYEYLDENEKPGRIAEVAEKNISNWKSVKVLDEKRVEEANKTVINSIADVKSIIDTIAELTEGTPLGRSFFMQGLLNSRKMFDSWTQTGKVFASINPFEATTTKAASLLNLFHEDTLELSNDVVSAISSLIDKTTPLSPLFDIAKAFADGGAVFEVIDHLGNTSYESEVKVRKWINSEQSGGLMPLYANIKKPLIVEANGRRWNNIKRLPEMGERYPETINTRMVAEFASENGCDGVIFKGLVDIGGYSKVKSQRSTVIIAFDSNQLKSVQNKTPTSDYDIRYQEREVSPITEAEYKDLEKHFGTTGNFRVAGYLLTDGKLLDFSGKHWGDTTSRMRQVDHRDVSEVLNRGNNGIDDMVDMIGNGNIRLMPEVGGINLAVYPNEKQRRVLSTYINYMLNTEGEVVIDYDAVGGDTVYSKTYGKTATSKQILSDIRNYFNGARQSELMQFHTMYQERSAEDISNRGLLANALESAATPGEEKNLLRNYKTNIRLIEAEQKRLSEIKDKLFEKGSKIDPDERKKLQSEMKQTATRINSYDRQLLKLEAMQPIKKVLEREKDMAKKRQKQKDMQILADYKEKSKATVKELLERNQESRKKAIEGRDKTFMRHKIKGIVNELNQLLLKGTKDKHVMIGLQKAVAEALDAVNMDTVGADERVAKYNALIAKAKDPDVIASLTASRDRIAEQGGRMSERLTALKDAYSKIKNSDDPLIANSHDEVIENKIESVVNSIGNTPLRDMTLEQLEDVYDMYKMVLTTIRNSNKAFKMEKAESISSLGNNIMREIYSIAGEKQYTPKALELLKKFGWSSLKPTQAFETIGSDTFKNVFANVRAGEDTWAVDVSEARNYYREKSSKYGYDSWDLEQRYEFTSKSGKKFWLSLEQIMSLYAYSKRKQADLHLDQGGFVFDESIEVVENKMGIPIKYKVNTANAYSISKEELGKIIGTLSDNQRFFVNEMQAYLSDVMGAKGNEVSLEMYGVKLFKEKYYFPLKSAKQFMFEQNEVAGEVKIKNSGFSKETVDRANNPIILSNFMDVWSKHVNDMSMYHAFVLPLEDFNRVFNYKTPTSDKMNPESVKSYLQNAYGTHPVQYIKQLITDLNGGARVDASAGFVNKGIALFKKGSVFASASVVIQQPSAIARAFAYINPKYFATAKVDLTKHSRDWEECKQYAPVARIKEMGYFDTNVGPQTTEWITAKEYKGFKEKLKGLKDSEYRDELLSKAPALADELAWTHIWNAVKKEIASTTNLKEGTEAFLKRAGERFTEVVVNTQVYDSVLTRSGLMRSKDTGVKMATAFMAEPTTSLNMIVNAFVQAKRGNKKLARNIVGGVAASIILNSILVSLVYAARDDDEDETYAEKYLGSLVSELIDGFNPITYIPFFKDGWSIALGYDVERSDMSVFSKLWESFEELFDEKKSVEEKVTDFSGSVATIFGFPLKNILRDVNAVINLASNDLGLSDTTGAGLGYSVSDALRNSIPLWGRFYEDDTKAEKLYDAIIGGDATEIRRAKSGYADEKSAQTAMKGEIKKRYLAGEIDDATASEYLIAHCEMEADDVYWEMQKWEYTSENGTTEGYTKYDDFISAVETGKNLKATIKEYIDNGVSEKTLASQITSHFKPLYIEMSKSERAKIKGYLLNAYAQLGYDRTKKSKDIDRWLEE